MFECASGCVERPALSIRWAAASDVGKTRRHNEDAFIAEGGIFIVADGMGGHRAGDVASQLAIAACRDLVDKVPVPLTDVEQLVERANLTVREQAAVDGTVGMGTTLVGIIVFDNAGDEGLIVLNVGDSRCYAYSAAGGLTQLTRDHSVVQELIDAGSLSSSDARSHPDRNVITRAIGIEPAVAADFLVLAESDQRLLICSDGVSGQITTDDLQRLLAEANGAEAAVEAVLAAVLAGPAPDNATAIVLDVAWQHADAAARADDDDITAPRILVPLLTAAAAEAGDTSQVDDIPAITEIPGAPVDAELAPMRMLIDSVPLAPGEVPATDDAVVTDPDEVPT